MAKIQYKCQYGLSYIGQNKRNPRNRIIEYINIAKKRNYKKMLLLVIVGG